MKLQGTDIHDPNFRLRFFSLIFMGVLALGSVVYWRGKLLANAEYVDLQPPKVRKTQPDDSKSRSQNFELETIETSPSVK